MNRLEFYLAANHGFTHAVLLGVPVLILGLAVDGDFSRERLITWFALGGMAYGLGALPAGWLASHKPRAALSGGLLLAAVGLLLAGVAPSLTGPALIVTGSGLAAYHPAGIGVLAELHPKRRGRLLARNSVGGNVGQVAGPVAASAWIWTTPQAVFLLFAGTALVILALGLGVVDREGRRGRRGALRPLLTRPMLLLQLASATNGFAFRAVVVLLPLVVAEHLVSSSGGVTMASAATIAAAMVTVATLAGIPGSLAVGPAIDRYGSARLVLGLSLVVLAGVSLFAAALTGALPGGLWLAAVGVALFGAATYGSQPALNTLLAQLTGPEGRSVIYGFTFALRFGVSFAAPLLALALRTWFELEVTMALLCAVAVLPAVALWWIRD